MDWLVVFVFQRIYQSPLLLSAYKLYKLLYRWTTNTTEIYRICHTAAKQLPSTVVSYNPADYDQDCDAVPLLEKTAADNIDTMAATLPPDVIYQIDRSILYSTQLQVERRQLESKDATLDTITHAVFTKKRFPGTMASPEAQILRASLSQIAATYQLTREVNHRAHTKYDSTNTQHEQKLFKLWNHLMPDTKLEARISKQWTDIGFQGQDPATDFRGMGLQGLDDLVYYCKTYPSSASRVFVGSQHPVSWYPFAIVGINISQFTSQVLRTRQLQFYLFKYGTVHDTYQDLYCYLFHSFNEYWHSHESPRLTVMDFEKVFQQFKRKIQVEIAGHRLVPLHVVLRSTPLSTAADEKVTATSSDDDSNQSKKETMIGPVRARRSVP